MPEQREHTRRAVLFLAGGALAAAVAGPAARAIALHNIHTGEHINSVYYADGKYVPETLRRVNWLLRDHRTDETYRMKPGLLDLLAKLHERLRTREPFQVLCG